MLMLSQAFGFVLSNMCLALAQISPTYGVILMAVCAFIAAGCTLLVSEDLQRKQPASKFKPLDQEIKISYEEYDVTKV